MLLNGERFKYREVSWDAATEKAANIAANKGGGDWDTELLSEWIKDLEALDFDLDLTLFDENELVSLLQDVEKVNAGDENDEWAKMGKKVEFTVGEKYITLAIHFKSELARDKFTKKHELEVFKKLKNVWIVRQ